MAAKPPLRFEEVQRTLRLLQPAVRDHRIVLVGGQAVSFWQRYLQRGSLDPELRKPLTSKDIDFEGSARAVRRAADLLSGVPRFPDADHVSSPNTGIVIFSDADGVTREIDFIEQPLGLSARDVRDTAVAIDVKADDGSPIRLLVMHPERCMESRVYNAQVLGKTGPLAMRQLRVSVICAREWSRYILDDETVAAEERVRAVLRLNERIFRKCRDDRRFRTLYLDGRGDPMQAILADDTRLPQRFRERRYPDMLAIVADRRRRDRANRARSAARGAS
ncbi:MAG TPA: hypothetical protein VFL73_05385 [Solirubrobacteraceae bacterium]|nr:hypothetical protein [Solirubrobacteraceae bacterium]